MTRCGTSIAVVRWMRSRQGHMSRRFGLSVIAGVLSLAAAPAQASHVPGATYRGTTPGGGSVELDVSADGASVTRFVAADVRGNCGGTLAEAFTGTLPIVDHAFSSSDPADPIRFDGSFPASGQAAGRLHQSSCPSSPVSWTATTGAPAGQPQPPPDRTPPALEARAGSSQPLRRGGAIRVRVRCPDEPCRVTARGSMRARGQRVFRLRRAVAQLRRGGAGARVQPRLGRRARAAARRALRSGRRVRVRVTVIAADAAGNRTVRRLTIRLRLRR
jgi:hypothetical protein